MSKFDDLMRELQKMAEELDALEQPKDTTPKPAPPIFARSEEVPLQTDQPKPEPEPSSSTAILKYEDVVAMQRDFARIAPGSKLALRKISEPYYSKWIEPNYDREALLDTFEAALDTGRSAHAIVKHEQVGSLPIHIISAVYAVMDMYKSLSFEQVLEFLRTYANNDTEEMLAFLGTDWFASQYWGVRPDRRHNFLRIIGEKVASVYGGGLAQAVIDIKEEWDHFQDRMARTSTSQRARLYREMYRQQMYDNREINRRRRRLDGIEKWRAEHDDR